LSRSAPVGHTSTQLRHRAHDGLSALVQHEAECIDLPHVPTDAHAAEAADAQIGVPQKERLVVVDRQTDGTVAWGVLGNTDMLGDPPKLAGMEDRAAALVLRDVGGARLEGAPRSLRALNARVGVCCEELSELRAAA
jgi:hypothetical protein